jgi:hypothetical protein
MKGTSFVVAMKKFFELKQGETLAEFNEELKALSNEERDEFAAMLAGQGLLVDMTTVHRKAA